jgi:serine/threonine-protein kinase
MNRLSFAADSIFDLMPDDEAWIGDVPYIVRQFGRGGMGFVVFLERDYNRHANLFQPIHRSLVAVKTVLPGLDDTAKKLFQRELTVWAGLDHPRIVHLNEILETRNDGWVAAMDWCAGSLQQFLNTHKKLSIKDALFIFQDVVEALHYSTTKRQIHHLDLKPANILYTTILPLGEEHKKNPAFQFRWAVSDWGIASVRSAVLARLVSATAADQLFKTFNNIGTEGYMAPERYVTGTSASTASDVFALGLMLFEMLTGHLPYIPSSDPISQQLLSHSYFHTARKCLSAAEIRPGVTKVILRMIAPDPAERHQEYECLVQELRDAYLKDTSLFRRLFKF